MSKKAIAAAIALAVQQAQAGVDYSPKTGATCPCCGATNLRVRNTMAWSGSMRVRFHLCTHAGCILASIKQGIKSVELDTSPAGSPTAGEACARA